MQTFNVLRPARPCVQLQGCCSALHKSVPSIRGGAPRRTAHVAAHAQTVADLPGNLKKIVGAFQMVPDAMSRYKQLLYFAAKLEGLDDGLKTEVHKVQGCVSQVWVIPEVREGKMYWKADSDAQLTKGLAALLVNGLSGCTPSEICSVEPEFIEMLGLKQSLTPSRNNGFLNMFRLMQSQALQGMKEMGDAMDAPEASDSATAEGSSGRASVMAASAATGWEPTEACPKPVAASIRAKLSVKLDPVELIVNDESAGHAGHAGAKATVSPSGETHFKVRVVSAAFEGLNTVKRHRLVYSALADELAGPLHALTLDTKAASEAL